MLNYLKKFAMEILPSVAATIIGAYIVNHYIATKPSAGTAPVAAASTVGPKAGAKPATEARPADLANIPEAGVKARGISERGLLEKNAAAEKSVVEKPGEKAADKPAETASIPTEPRRHAPAAREKSSVAKVTAPAPVPVVVAPNTAPPVEAAVAPEERRDANDLARAAIERLRGGNDGAPRTLEAARAAPEAPRVVTGPAVRPLPPPIMVSTPPMEAPDQRYSPAKPPYAADARVDDPHRPTPPAEIPAARPPLDLRAEMAEPPHEKPQKTSVAEDVLSAAKSVFHAVLPK